MGSMFSAAPLGLIGNWPNQHGVKAEEGLKSQMIFFMLNLSDVENPEIYQMMFQTYVWYSFNDEVVVKDGATYKETYGYPSLLETESENLFIENELPFTYHSFLQKKVFIKSFLVPDVK